jgi:hypothetical protein
MLKRSNCNRDDRDKGLHRGERLQCNSDCSISAVTASDRRHDEADRESCQHLPAGAVDLGSLDTPVGSLSSFMVGLPLVVFRPRLVVGRARSVYQAHPVSRRKRVYWW